MKLLLVAIGIFIDHWLGFGVDVGHEAFLPSVSLVSQDGEACV